jgi:hypothetical protein
MASFIPWLMVVAGVALGVSYVLRALRVSLNADAFTPVVRKLLEAANAERVVKLTRAAPDSPLAAATRAAVEVCARGVPQGDPAADYRSAGDLSPEHVLAPVRAAWDDAFEALARPVRVARYVAIVGLLPLVAALALAVTVSPPAVAPAIAAALALALLAWTGRTERRLIASRDASFEALRGSLDAFIRDPKRAPVAVAPTRVRVTFEVSEPGRAPRVEGFDDDVIRIGSMPTAQVCLDAPGVARMHAVVEAADGRFSIIDLGSESPTRVNGEGVNRRELADGDVISIGGAELRVRLGG